ncbi:sigma-54 interaction domain-containing protein [Occallatibacter riparius]|uniref:Sigma 54-interacting transcriptional regulator n=1 Tax=Occallatibacter riparius TaxID=1002689 RepID=A0A9J7BTS0_9BACT|nr:sigma 54-interacting transcriptional regulator [Occallatibacter riparius]UWZ84389.1 sigma 54-interacting transcriptional regulator [Occallatibacter riparius]
MGSSTGKPQPRQQEERDQEFAQIVGTSAALESVLAEVERVAPTGSTVLILGETGTGKELIARAIHNVSTRCGCPFVKLNCAAIPFDLLESELFGHERGAFTGAVAHRVGRFEMADTGTLFLDEIGDLPLALQPKLLRVIQEQEFERLGSGRTHRINVRLVAATHRDLSQMVARNEFRSDLYYRLNVFPISIPPLRQRRDDIRELVMHFVDVFSRRMGKRIEEVPQSTLNAFAAYDWPGNVRELQNLVERAVIRSDDGVLPNPLSPAEVAMGSAPKLGAIEVSRRRTKPGALPDRAYLDSLEDIQRQHILRVLDRTGWLISGPNGAGAILNIHPNTLRSLMDRLGIRNNTSHSSLNSAQSPCHARSGNAKRTRSESDACTE